jgi:outer membrane protein, multidrug efflux system
MKHILTLLAFALAFSAAGQKREPKLQIPEQWSQQAGSQAVRLSETDALRTWWAAFNDSELVSLVERAIKTNPDLKTAAFRVAEARAARGMAKSALGPSIATSDGFTKVRGGIAQGLNGAGLLSGSPQSRASLLTPFETNVFQAGVDSSWELDLFGGVRNSVKAADADLVAAEEARTAVRVSLAGEVGSNYMALRGAQRRLAIVQENIALQEDSIALTEARRNAGLAPDLDVIRATAQLKETEAERPPLQTEIDRATHALAVLIGLAPAALASELSQVAPLPSLPVVLEAGIPADLLRRRPDLRRAEAEIVAAVARIGVARSDLYPKLTFNGLVGRQGTEISALSLGIGSFFSFGPGLRLPLFTSGRIRSNILVQEERWSEAASGYEAAVLRAQAEVEDALSALRREQTRQEALRVAEARDRDASGLTVELYSKGLGDYLSVLDSQRELLSVQQQLALSQTNAALDVVTLYKSLGGGW